MLKKKNMFKYDILTNFRTKKKRKKPANLEKTMIVSVLFLVRISGFLLPDCIFLLLDNSHTWLINYWTS